MVEMQVTAVGQDPAGHQNFLILQERAGRRRLVLAIGPFEALSIAFVLGKASVARPMTHDLVAQTIARLGASIQRVLIHDVRDQAFIAQLELETGRGIIELDCRPSDGVAVALRTGSPIYAAEQVLDEAGVVPDDDVEDAPAGSPESS